MNAPPRAAWAVLFFTTLLLLSAGCQSTEVTTNWKDPSVTRLSFSNVAIVVLDAVPAQRRAEEEAIVSQIKTIRSAASYGLIPDDQLKDPPAAKKKIIDGGFDGAIVVRHMGTRQTRTSFSNTTTWNDQWGSTAYRDTGQSTVASTLVDTSVEIYSVPDGRLLWSGKTQTLNPSEDRAFATSLATAVATELRKQGLLQ